MVQSIDLILSASGETLGWHASLRLGWRVATIRLRSASCDMGFDEYIRCDQNMLVR